MATVELTKNTFIPMVGRYPLSLVHFGADWCPTSRAFRPVFDAAANRHPDLLFGRVDTDVQKELSGSFSIRYIPTVVVVRDGMIVFNDSGSWGAQDLADLIRDMRTLDMDRFRAAAVGGPAATPAPQGGKVLGGVRPR